MIMEKLKNNTIVITSYENKVNILKEINKKDKLINIKFLTKEELLKKYYFSYDEKTIYYLMNKYGYKYEVAKLYLDNLYYISNKDYNYKKLEDLKQLKQELKDNDLLYFDELFIKSLKDKEIVFYNYNYFSKLEKSMISDLKDYANVIVLNPKANNYTHTVYSFDTIFEEVEYVAKSILSLVDQGIPLDRIKLTNINSDYYDITRRIFSMYNLKTSFKDNCLISTNIANLFLKSTLSFEDAIENLSQKYKNNPVLEQLINIVNKYIYFDNKQIAKEMIIYQLKNTYLKDSKYQNTVEVIDYLTYPISEDMHVFMMSFNSGCIPIIYKDEDYISDNIKKGLLLDQTNDKNKLVRETTINIIKSIKNLYITYKTSTPFSFFYPSNLISDLNYNEEKGKIDYKTSYSPLADKTKLASCLNKYFKTKQIEDPLKLLYSNYPSSFYNTYSNTFKGINRESFKEYKPAFNLSYSSMDVFYKCPFRYYLNEVLKLNIYEDNFSAYIGSMFHYVLEKSLKQSSDIDTLINDFIKENDRILTKKETFFINKFRPDVKFAYDTIIKQLSTSNLKEMCFEKKVEVIKKGAFDIIFKGYIDKIMYEIKDGKTIASIIDYKTYDADIDLGYVPYGLSMQLPVYLYLARNSKEFKDATFAGFYLQQILNPKVSIDPVKSVQTLKEEKFKLSGYSNSDMDILYRFDNDFENSSTIKSMKITKTGDFHSNAKTLSDLEIDKLVSVTDQKIEEAISNITQCNFDISPKKTEKKLLGCEFCNYKDICFKEKKDEILIKKDKDLSFLGGDLDA